MKNLWFAIIKKISIPSRMNSFTAIMKILIASSIKRTKTFSLIFHCMRMNKIHDDLYPHSMSFINQFFKLIRSSKTR